MKDWILLAIVVAMLTGWLAGCSKASSSETLIEYRRSGGFAGWDDHLVVEKDGEAVLTRKSERFEFTLNSDTTNRLQTLFERRSFPNFARRTCPRAREAISSSTWWPTKAIPCERWTVPFLHRSSPF